MPDTGYSCNPLWLCVTVIYVIYWWPLEFAVLISVMAMIIFKPWQMFASKLQGGK